MIDYHNHTKLCKHAEGEIFEYVEKAIELEITEFAFTDHIPLPGLFDIRHRMYLEEMEQYIKLVEQARIKYPEIKILLGIEAEYYEGFEKFTEDFLQLFDFDLVIMSVHFIKSWTDGNWVFKYNFPNRKQSDIYQEYLNTVIKGIETNLFDIVGHIDLIKRIGFPLIQTVQDEVRNVLKKIKQKNMVLEINTSGYRRKIAEPYPGLDWIELIKEFDVPVCIGSDSHSPEQVGLQFDKIYRFLADSGIDKIAHFNERKYVLNPINITNKTDNI